MIVEHSLINKFCVLHSAVVLYCTFSTSQQWYYTHQMADENVGVSGSVFSNPALGVLFLTITLENSSLKFSRSSSIF